MLTEFGKLLRIIRMNSGDNADEMAKKLYISSSYLYLIENGKRRIPADMEKSIINAYRISPSERESLHRAIIAEQLERYESSSGLYSATNDGAPVKERGASSKNAGSQSGGASESNARKRLGKAAIIAAFSAAAVAVIVLAIVLTVNHYAPSPSGAEQTDNAGPSTVKSTEMFEYKETDGLICITKYIGVDENVTIPSEIDGKSVYEIGECAFANDRIVKRVVLSDGIKRIGFQVFENCPNLEYIEIPDSVYYIGKRFATNCQKLKEVVLGNGITFTNATAFENCTSLEIVKLGSKVCQIDHDTFSSCKSLSEIELPNGLKTICFSAFYKCTGLKSIVLPDGIMSVEERAFESCSNLESIYVPSSLKWFSNDIFKDCPKLTVYGEAGTGIERYCEENGYAFKAISDISEMK